MSRNHWQEIDKALSDGRRELVLTGESITSRLADGGEIDDRIFSIVNLNFLEISKVGLITLPERVSLLEGLTNLGLNGNRLTTLPSTIGQLKKLKFIDVSFNQLTTLPGELGSLKELQSLNVSNNLLSTFIDISGLVKLHVLDVSHNALVDLPPGITDEQLNLLLTVSAHHNQIGSLPDDLCNLAVLKLLDVSDNVIEELPLDLCDCGKLKDFKFDGNKLKDKRLAKMAGQCSTKAVLDYLRNARDKDQKVEKKKGGASLSGSSDKGKKKTKGKGPADAEVKSQSMMTVLHFAADAGVTIQVTPAAMAARPYIVCCVVRNVNFLKSQSMMKRFLLIQTKLHDGLCAKRQAATIATHDLESLKLPLTYDAKPPSEIKLVPLNKKKETTAANLVGRLRQEAEALRKESKRNTLSGIHKYLDLLKGKSVYPCLVDANDVVISFPPITNCNSTKVLNTTRHILIEVTSSVSLDISKKVMDELLEKLLHMGIGQSEEPARVIVDLGIKVAQIVLESGHVGKSLSSSDTTDDSHDAKVEVAASSSESDVKELVNDDNGEEEENEDEDDETQDRIKTIGEQILILEQVKVIDHMGGLKIVYPSRVDLKSDSYTVSRDYE